MVVETGQYWFRLQLKFDWNPVDLSATNIFINPSGKEHACAVGITMMSSAEIKEKGKDTAVTSVHALGDGLWKDYMAV